MKSITISHEEFLLIVRESSFNWFKVIDRVMEQNSEVSEENIAAYLENLFSIAMNEGYSGQDKALLEQSHQAFCCDSARHT